MITIFEKVIFNNNRYIEFLLNNITDNFIMKPNKTSVQQIKKNHNKENLLVDKKKNKIYHNNEKDTKSQEKPIEHYYKYHNSRSKQSNHDKIHHHDILKPRAI